jgi:alkaline phosphatase
MILHRRRYRGFVVLSLTAMLVFFSPRQGVAQERGHLAELQHAAIKDGVAAWGHWGTRPDVYTQWQTHSNRLVPVYTFGATIEHLGGKNSAYRRPSRLTRIYGQVPSGTLNPEAEYFDQTDIYQVQSDAIAAGKKYIFLVIFDGMDWQTTQLAAIYRSGKVGYTQGRGTGLAFQDYDKVPTSFGFMVTTPHNDRTEINVDKQIATLADVTPQGGYHPIQGGATPWDRPGELAYLEGEGKRWKHIYTDSASSGTAMMSGVKTYNKAINTGRDGQRVTPISHRLQQRQGYGIGVVTSVPFCHATPATAYAHNVTRDDFQDIARDMLGLPSVSHPDDILPGVDVLLGTGWGIDKEEDPDQGENFVPGNRYITQADMQAASTEGGGPYTTVTRQAGQNGTRALREAAAKAVEAKGRLFGIFGSGTIYNHLPFRTADGKYNPVQGSRDLEKYTPADIEENPTLADMTEAALQVLEQNDKGFWLMVEAGDVDWANHDNNIDKSIGAVISGEEAFVVITRWAEKNDRWKDTVVIVAADHGHLFTLLDPSALLEEE